MTIQDIDFNLSKLVEAFDGFIKRFAKGNVNSGVTNLREKISKVNVCQKAISLVQRVLCNH